MKKGSMGSNQAAFFERLFEDFPDAIVILSSQGEIQFWNKRAEEIFGYTRDETIGHTIPSLIVPPHSVQQEHEQFQQTLVSAHSDFEAERLCKDGSMVHVHASYRVDRSESGEILRVVTTHKDVTQLKVLNDSRILDAKYRDLLESTPDAIIITNRTGNIVLVNEQTVTIFGYDRRGLIGQRVEILLPERFHSAHLGHRAGYVKHPRQRSMGAGLELFGRRRNGKEFPVEISLSPLESDDGLFVMSAIRDITERKRSEQKFRALLESAPDAIVIADREGAITLLNAQAQSLFGFSSEELLGQTIEVLVPQRFRDSHVSHRIAYFSNPRIRPVNTGIELFGLRKDGSEFPAEISLSPLETEDGTFVISAIRNVSDRKRIEHALQRANSELEAFAYSVSHDLRAPLRTVDGFSQAILEDYGENLPDEGTKYLLSIRAGAQQMGKLIDDLLEFSRLGRQSISKRKIDVNKLVREVLESLSDVTRDRAVKLNIADLPACSGDHTLIRQVWQNLISNALKYSRGRTPAIIEVGAKVEGNAVTYFVRDNGTGFNMRYYDKLFGVFQRLHKSEDFEGTGVGLAIVHRVLDRHGGKIWAESVLDKGATFYFTLEEGTLV